MSTTAPSARAATSAPPAEARLAAIRWVTELFCSATAARVPTDTREVGARAAYQELLYGRSAFIDARSELGRARDGGRTVTVPSSASASAVAVAVATMDDSVSVHGRRLVVLVDEPGNTDQREAAAAPLELAGALSVHFIRGGLAAWMADGLPVTAPATPPAHTAAA